jgi:hypothetical protein
MGAMPVLPLVLAAVVALVVLVFVMRSRRLEDVGAHESPALDAVVADVIERELLQHVFQNATDGERSGLKKALRGTDADIDVVSRLEQAVKSIDLEFVRFAHEADAEVNITLTYEDGKTTKLTRRMGLLDVPRPVRESFEKSAVTRAFHAWQLPWRR